LVMDSDRRGQATNVTLRVLQRSDDGPTPAKPTFQQLFAENARYVWRTLRRLGARDAELEDLTHDVFLQVFRHLEEYDPARPIKPWLFAFALRVASQDRRRVRRKPELATESLDPQDSAPTPIEHLLLHERRALARAALDELELNRRAVFILHELDGCPIPEVAASLQLPLATAYSRLRLAREDFARSTRRLLQRQR
jgi:RNA polymerase sigma-70 factor (ECF subfamily)